MQRPRRASALLLLFAASLTTGAVCLPAASGTAGAEAASFEREMELADKAPDRDAKVEHLRNALALRPNDPENIKIEHRIVVLLSQVRDIARGQAPQPDEALREAERLLATYRHMAYYESQPPNSSSSAQMLVPETAILAACLSSGQGDPKQARRYLWQAMACLQQTWEARRKDWLAAPPPRELPLGTAGLPLDSDAEKFGAKYRIWQEHRRKAQEGDCFGPLEMVITKAAVRQYGYSFGPHKAQEVPLPMVEVIRAFPGTPMARIAQEHIDRSASLMLRDILKEIPQAEVTEMIPPDAQAAPHK